MTVMMVIAEADIRETNRIVREVFEALLDYKMMLEEAGDNGTQGMAWARQ